MQRFLTHLGCSEFYGAPLKHHHNCQHCPQLLGSLPLLLLLLLKPSIATFALQILAEPLLKTARVFFCPLMVLLLELRPSTLRVLVFLEEASFAAAGQSLRKDKKEPCVL
jgi:hypothetical protein